MGGRAPRARRRQSSTGRRSSCSRRYGSYRPDVIPKLVEPILDSKHDFLIGSHTRGRGEPGSMGIHQALAGGIIGAAVGPLYNVKCSDMCPFRAIRADALQRLGMREMTYGWNLEMQMRGARAGLRILEVPVPHGRRLAGRSKVAGTFRGTLKAGSGFSQPLSESLTNAKRERRHGQAG